VTVENEFFLPREIDVQRYHACVYTPEFRPAPIEFGSSPGSRLLGGRESITFDVDLPGLVFYDDDGNRLEGVRGRETIPVETDSECPERADEPKVVVVPRPGPTRR